MNAQTSPDEMPEPEGAPWPPAAISRLRKSQTTILPVSSASNAPLPELDRVSGVRSMPDGLAMTTDRLHACGTDACFLQQIANGSARRVSPVRCQRSRLRESRRVGAGEGPAACVRNDSSNGVKDFANDLMRVVGKPQQHGVDAVETGPRHQSDVAIADSSWPRESSRRSGPGGSGPPEHFNPGGRDRYCAACPAARIEVVRLRRKRAATAR